MINVPLTNRRSLVLQMQPACQSLKIQSSWWLSHSFSPLGRPVSFHSSALLEVRFWCQYREEICFTKGHNSYTYGWVSKYLPLISAHILVMFLYNRTPDRIFGEVTVPIYCFPVGILEIYLILKYLTTE